jgi:hypothetical protein
MQCNASKQHKMSLLHRAAFPGKDDICIVHKITCGGEKHQGDLQMSLRPEQKPKSWVLLSSYSYILKNIRKLKLFFSTCINFSNTFPSPCISHPSQPSSSFSELSGLHQVSK